MCFDASTNNIPIFSVTSIEALLVVGSIPDPIMPKLEFTTKCILDEVFN